MGALIRHPGVIVIALAKLPSEDLLLLRSFGRLAGDRRWAISFIEPLPATQLPENSHPACNRAGAVIDGFLHPTFLSESYRTGVRPVAILFFPGGGNG